MSGSNKKNVQKIEAAATLAAKSKGMQSVLAISEAQWVAILAELDENKLDELIYVLSDEAETYVEIKKKRQRRHKVNDTRRLQRLERLKIRMEEINKQANQ